MAVAPSKRAPAALALDFTQFSVRLAVRGICEQCRQPRRGAGVAPQGVRPLSLSARQAARYGHAKPRPAR